MVKKRALIVDDSSTAQYRLKKMLRSYELDIDVMDSGEAALRYLATNEPDVIFMDHMMPGMDGFRVLQIIKSHPETATIPVIMYTAKSGDVYTGQARALGALDVVSKDTINATDLSKVMQTIHLYPQSSNTEQVQEKILQTEAEIIPIKSAANETETVSPAAFVERRKANRANNEQARNLELRLSHLETTLEDSRRFITSRVVKELQNLKQNLRQEITGLQTQSPAAEPVAPPKNSRWNSGLSVAAILCLLIVAIIYIDRLNDSLNLNQKQQQVLNEKVEQMIDQQKKLAESAQSVDLVNDMALPKNTASGVAAETGKNSAAQWEDLAWVFNQSGNINFAQNQMDLKILLRLHELVARAINKGFKGTVAISFSVGNFCVVNNPQGQAQLAPDNSSAAACMLSSELYGLDNLEKRYSSDIETVLGNLSKQQKKAVNIVIAAAQPNETYPERLANVPARDWNAVAQANNRVDIKLDAAH